MRPLPSTWTEPPWDEPLDAQALIHEIPSFATITGAFLRAVVDLARSRGVHVAGRGSYVGFRRYPLREHATLLVEAARGIWPQQTLRSALRRLGRGAAHTLGGTILGRVVLGSVEGPVELLKAMAKAYPLHTQPGSIDVVELEPREVVVRIAEIHHFLDSHHVGVFEGVLRHAKVLEPRVQIHTYSRITADLLCTWSRPPANQT